jgi:hypothetical protein
MQGGTNMKTYRLLFTIILGLILSSCSTDETNALEEPEACEECVVCEETLVCEECPISPFPEGLVLPQIYILGKLHWSTADLDGLNTNIIDPILAYYEAENRTVVAISVRKDDPLDSSYNTIIIEVFMSDNNNSQDSLYIGMLIEKVDGAFPIWEHESIGP